jgi:RNase P protein component
MGACSVLILVLVRASTAIVFVAQQEASTVRNKNLQSELLRMKAQDQRYRGQMQAEIIKMSSSGTTEQSKEFKAVLKKQNEIDRKNLVRLAEIIKRHGWPGRSLVGEEATNASVLILQHADLTFQKKYFSLVKEGARKGEVRAADAAMLEDRILMLEGKKQIYGSAVQSGPETGGKLQLHPIEDEDHVDERRAAVGLMPLAEYLKQFGLEYKRRNEW